MIDHDGDKSRKWRSAAIGASGIFIVASTALFFALLYPAATDAAMKLGIDASWWLWAVGMAFTGAVGGYGAMNNWEKIILGKFGSFGLARPAPEEKKDKSKDA